LATLVISSVLSLYNQQHILSHIDYKISIFLEVPAGSINYSLMRSLVRTMHNQNSEIRSQLIPFPIKGDITSAVESALSSAIGNAITSSGNQALMTLPMSESIESGVEINYELIGNSKHSRLVLKHVHNRVVLS